ncbi:MAG: phosphodiester glycosidase family protein [Chloroflexota bacterium]
MKYKNNRNTGKLLIFLVMVIVLTLACSLSGSGSVSSTKETLFNGVTYIREVRTSPRDMVIHIVKINLVSGGIRPHVTEPDNPKSDKPYNARTTSQYLRSSGVQLAINGSGFKPWFDLGVIYSPHKGDPVAPLGTTISGDFSYTFEESQKRPMLGFNGTRPADISWIAGSPDYLISGTRMLVENWTVMEDLDSSETSPRTAVGVSEDGHTLIIVVVDGRQLGYSQGATLEELAQILADHGAHKAMELDGGGSSTLVIEGEDGQPIVLNSPVHQGSNGKERPVATHIGFFIRN